MTNLEKYLTPCKTGRSRPLSIGSAHFKLNCSFFYLPFCRKHSRIFQEISNSSIINSCSCMPEGYFKKLKLVKPPRPAIINPLYFEVIWPFHTYKEQCCLCFTWLSKTLVLFGLFEAKIEQIACSCRRSLRLSFLIGHACCGITIVLSRDLIGRQINQRPMYDQLTNSMTGYRFRGAQVQCSQNGVVVTLFK